MGSLVVILTLQPLYTQGNMSWYSLNGKLGGLQSGQPDAPAALHPRNYVLVLIVWEAGSSAWRSSRFTPKEIYPGTHWMGSWVGYRMVSLTLQPLCTQGNMSWYSLNGNLGGQQSRSGRFGGEKIAFSLPGIESRIVQPVAQSLYELRYPDSLL